MKFEWTKKPDCIIWFRTKGAHGFKPEQNDHIRGTNSKLTDTCNGICKRICFHLKQGNQVAWQP